MSPKTTPNAERPSADKLAASAGRAMASPAVSDKGPIPAIVEGLHLKSSRKRRQARADLVQLRLHAGSHTTLPVHKASRPKSSSQVFAGDSLLEGTGFELPVPREIRFGFRCLVAWPPLRRGGPRRAAACDRSKLLPVRPMAEAGRSSWRSFLHFYGASWRFRDDRAIGRSTARSVATRRALTPAQ